MAPSEAPTPTAVPEYAYTINKITADGGKVKANITKHTEKNGTLILCAYNADGALVDIKTEQISVSGEFETELNTADAKTITAFVWDYLGGLKPLALPKTTEIN